MTSGRKAREIERAASEARAWETEYAKRDANCQCCRPRPAVLRALSVDHALTLVRSARRVWVRCRVTDYRDAMFVVARKEALSELTRLPLSETPTVSLHLGSRQDGHGAFVG